MIRVIKEEIKKFSQIFKQIEKKVIIIFIAIAILQTISWYFASRRFFRLNLAQYFTDEIQVKVFELIYWFSGDFITYFIFPILIIVFVFKEKLYNYGLTVGDAKFGLATSTIFLTLMLPLIWFFSSSPDFIVQYPHLSIARNDWTIFILYEVGIFIYLLAWEFVWRGFVLFGLYEKFGNYAIFIQMIPFVILHNGKPFPETIGAIAGGIILGYFALRTKSIYYCVITHSGVMLMIDLISTLRFRTEEYGIGISSIIRIMKELF